MGLLSWLLGETVLPAPPATARRRVTRVSRGGARNTQSLYEERGWKLRGDTLYGWYRTRFGAFEGRIDNALGASPCYSIFRPPQKLLDGPHGPCFRQREANRFEIHWSDKPSDVNAGILRVEHTLIEALR